MHSYLATKMNKLTILTTIFSTVAYCAARRDCDITLTDAELYTTAINISCSDELNRFTNISSDLVNYLADINGGNFKLKSQVDASDHHCTIDNITDIGKIMEHFTPICQRYTDVMAHKYYLQHLLFHRNNDATVLIKLTSVLINLQVLANSLQTIQMEEDNSCSCVKFTPCQYKKIYYSRLPMNKSTTELDALCLLQVGARNWQDRNDIYI